MLNPEIVHPFNLEQRTEPAPNFAVLTPFEFLADFRTEAQGAKQRVWAQAMSMETGTSQNMFFDAIREANERGLDVKLRIDWFSHLTSRDGIHSVIAVKSLLGLTQRPGPNRLENERMFKTLQENGIDIQFTNYPKLWEIILPYFGRNHMKMYIVDDVVYLGGMNIEDSCFEQVDFMVKLADPEVVEEASKQFEYENPTGKDKKVDFSVGDSLLIDSGKPGRSIILDTAIGLVKGARSSVRNISFFTPDGPLIRALNTAHQRGIDVEVLKPDVKWKSIYGIINLKNTTEMKLGHLEVPFARSSGGIHAKLLVVDNEVAIFGSHNLMESGVKAGTQEIAYMTINPELVRNLMGFYSRIRSSAQ